MNVHTLISSIPDVSDIDNMADWFAKCEVYGESVNKTNIRHSANNGLTFIDDDNLRKRHRQQVLSYLKSELYNQEGENVVMTKENVFIVYAHKGETIKLQVQDFIQNTLKFVPHTLDISKYTGSIWDAFVRESQVCSKAIVVMTADDEIHDGDIKYYQSRPNVFIELGYLIHKCNLDNVTIVSNGDVEMPTDISGIIHVKMDNPNWKESIRNQMNR